MVAKLGSLSGIAWLMLFRSLAGFKSCDPTQCSKATGSQENSMCSVVKEKPVHFLPPSPLLFFLSFFFTFLILSCFPPFFQEILLSRHSYQVSSRQVLGEE